MHLAFDVYQKLLLAQKIIFFTYPFSVLKPSILSIFCNFTDYFDILLEAIYFHQDNMVWFMLNFNTFLSIKENPESVGNRWDSVSIILSCK